MFRRSKILLRAFRSPKAFRDSLYWTQHQWSLPAPQEVKWSVLRRYGSGVNTWIETGTFLGDTTKMLSQIALEVVSIEPSDELFQRARNRFSGENRIKLFHGTSEALLEDILKGCSDSVALWLDGHYSGGSTYKGSQVSPILQELEAVRKFVNTGGSAIVFVDDLRLFGDPLSGYPGKFQLVTWAEDNGAWWTVEHDIFIAKLGLK